MIDFTWIKLQPRNNINKFKTIKRYLKLLCKHFICWFLKSEDFVKEWETLADTTLVYTSLFGSKEAVQQETLIRTSVWWIDSLHYPPERPGSAHTVLDKDGEPNSERHFSIVHCGNCGVCRELWVIWMAELCHIVQCICLCVTISSVWATELC